MQDAPLDLVLQEGLPATQEEGSVPIRVQREGTAKMLAVLKPKEMIWKVKIVRAAARTTGARLVPSTPSNARTNMQP